MAGKIKWSFKGRMLMLVLGTSWLMMASLMVWQSVRESRFKADLLDAQLQMLNQRILDDMDDGENIQTVLQRIKPPMPDMRISLIDSMGRVTYDTSEQMNISNHSDRPEVLQARVKGHGYVAARQSEGDTCEYFYSATRGKYGLVVRSAVPYNYSLLDTLKADMGFLWVMVFITLVISVVGYVGARRVSNSLRRLNRFAERADKGERIFTDTHFPDDELGAISAHIVRLYSRLQQVMNERDEQHAEALRAEREKEEFKKQLTIDINHELKTPVASIILTLETVRDFPDLRIDMRDELLDRLMTNAVRLQNMLKDISVITRLDEGTELIKLSAMNLAEIVRDTAADLRPTAARANIEIVVEVPQEAIMINGNQSLLESIFRNLIRNSILYSGGTRINIKYLGKGQWSVSDDGCGIPEEHFPNIFNRFYRLEGDRSRKRGGTGLGLAIVRNAVVFHGGDITIANLSPGLIFTFTLPELPPDFNQPV